MFRFSEEHGAANHEKALRKAREGLEAGGGRKRTGDAMGQETRLEAFHCHVKSIFMIDNAMFYTEVGHLFD